jgi:hypothetical protein
MLCKIVRFSSFTLPSLQTSRRAAARLKCPLCRSWSSRCSRCLPILVLSDVRRHIRYPDGHLRLCRSCGKMRGWLRGKSPLFGFLIFDVLGRVFVPPCCASRVNARFALAGKSQNGFEKVLKCSRIGARHGDPFIRTLSAGCRN